MKIVLYTSAASHIDDYSMHIWDYYCNFKRMANNLTGMDFTIEHGTDISTLNKAALNVLHISNWQITSKDKKMLDNNIDVFDLIICNNNMEHSMAMNADVLRYLKNKPVYLVMGSFLSTNHSLYNKVISFSYKVYKVPATEIPAMQTQSSSGNKFVLDGTGTVPPGSKYGFVSLSTSPGRYNCKINVYGIPYFKRILIFIRHVLAEV